MGIDINSFEIAAQSRQKWLSVNADDKTKLVASNDRRAISVGDLKTAGAGDLNKAADNVYLRGQLLEGIRNSLVSAKLMRVSWNATSRQEEISYRGQAAAADEAAKTDVQKFFEKAEAALFGKLGDNGQYGLTTASQDLDKKTVVDLILQLDKLTKPNAKQSVLEVCDKLDTNCPRATDKQRDALIHVDYKALGKALGRWTSTAKTCKVTGLVSVADGRYLLCSLKTKKGDDLRVLVDRDGKFVDYNKSEYGKCRDALYPMGWMADLFAPEDLPEINHLLSFSADGKEDRQLLVTMLSTMLPTALAKARREVPSGHISIATWCKVLGLCGQVPATDKANQQTKAAFTNAVTSRFESDYRAVKGLDPSVNLQEDRGFLAYRNSMTDGVSYETRLFCLKHGFMPSKDAYPGGCVLHSEYLDAGAEIGDFDQKVANELAGQRAKGTAYRLNKEQFFVNNCKPNEALSAVNFLRENGFTDRQIYAMSFVPNNVGMSILPGAGYLQVCTKSKIDISAGVNGDMVVRYDFKCHKPDPDNPYSFGIPTNDSLMYAVTIHRDGTMECTDLKVVLGAKKSDGDLQIELGGEAGMEEINTSTVERTGVNPSERQMEVLDKPDFAQIAQRLGFKPGETGVLSISDMKTAPDGKFVECMVKSSAGKSKTLYVGSSGKLYSKAEYKYYQKCAETDQKRRDDLMSDELLEAWFQTNYDRDDIVASFDPVEFAELSYWESLLDSNKLLNDWQNNGLLLKGCLLNMMPQAMARLREQGPVASSPEKHFADMWKCLGLGEPVPSPDDQELKDKFRQALTDRVAHDVALVLGPPITVQDVKDAAFPSSREAYNQVGEKLGRYFVQNIIADPLMSSLGMVSGLPYETVVKTLKDRVFVPQMSDFFYRPSEPLPDSKLQTGKYGGHDVPVSIMENMTNFQLERNSARKTYRYPNVSFSLNGKEIAFGKVKGMPTPQAGYAYTFLNALTKAGFTERQIVKAAEYANEDLFAHLKTMGIGQNGFRFNITKAPEGMRLRVEVPCVKRVGVNVADGPTSDAPKSCSFKTEDTGRKLVHEIVIKPDGSFVMTYNGLVEPVNAPKANARTAPKVKVAQKVNDVPQFTFPAQVNVDELAEKLNGLGCPSSYPFSVILRSFESSRLGDVQFLTSLLEMPDRLAANPLLSFLPGALLNMLPDVFASLQQKDLATTDPQAHFAELWNGLGLQGAAPLLTDSGLKMKFFQAFSKRVCTDLADIVRRFGVEMTVLEVQTALYPESRAAKAALDQKFGNMFISNIVAGKLYSAITNVSGVVYADVLRMYGDPSFVLSKDRLFFSPKEPPLAQGKLKRSKSSGYEILDDVSSNFTITRLKGTSGGRRRYNDVVFSVNGEDIVFENSTSKSDVDHVHHFESTMKKKGFSDQQIVRVASYVNDTIFSDRFAFNADIYSYRMDARLNPDLTMSLTVEIPLRRSVGFSEDKSEFVTKDTGKTWVQELCVQPDGSYVLVSQDWVENQDA